MTRGTKFFACLGPPHSPMLMDSSRRGLRYASLPLPGIAKALIPPHRRIVVVVEGRPARAAMLPRRALALFEGL